MDIEKIRQLIALLNETNIDEIEIKEGDESVRICREKRSPAAHTIQYSAPGPSAPLPMNSVPVAAEDEHNGLHIIYSPMVGTVYFSPSPEAEKFVTLGQSIQAGDTVCLIEAMKMFNEIESDQSGVIKKILVENGQPVEYGQPLFAIE